MVIRRVALSAVAAALLVPLVAALPVGAEPPAEQAAGVEASAVRLPRPAPAKADKAAYEPGTVLVRFKPKATATARSRALTSRGASAARTVSSANGFELVTVRSGKPAPELLASLRKDPAVASASLNFRREKTITPNDPAFTERAQDYYNVVRMPAAWDLARGPVRHVVAVLDTGFETSHPDLAGRLTTGYNAVTPGAPLTDRDGHGTFVAGVVAANTHNGLGVAGTTWNGKVMPVKVFSDDGYAYDDDIVRGIVFAVGHGAKIINLSLGSSAPSSELRAGLAHAQQHGVLVFAAAGNTGASEEHYPAAYPEAVAVGATDSSGRLTDFSTNGDWVDLAAPGFQIASTYPGQGYAVGDGTSFASPIAAGVAALVWARFPSYSATQVTSRLKATARDSGPRGLDPYYGWGVVDAYHAVGGTWGTELPLAALGSGEPNDTPSRAIALNGQVVTANGTIANEGDADWYTYQVTSANPTRFRVTPPPFVESRAQNSDTMLEVYQPDGSLALRQDWGTVGETEAVLLDLPPGTYLVKVSNFNGSRDERPYTLGIAPDAAATRPPVPATPLWVENLYPVNFAGGVDVNGNVTVGFNRDVTSVSSATVYLRNGRTGYGVPATVTLSGRVATIDPTAPLQDNTPYRVMLNGVKDTSGQTIPAGFLSTFRTQDLAPPKVTGFTGQGSQPRAYLGWGKPDIHDLDRYVVRAGTGNSWPTCGTCGYPIYTGLGTTVLTQPLANTATHNFRIWVVDRAGRWSGHTDVRLVGTRFGTSYSTTQLTYGQSVRIGGRLNLTDNGALVTGVPVTLWGKQKGTSTWRALGTATTGSAGTVSFTHRPNASTDCQLRYVGRPGVLGSVGGVIPVGVRPAMSFRANRTTLPLGQTVTLYVGVNPAHPGHTVYLQRLLPSGWTHVTTGRLNSGSGYGFTLRPTARGSYAYRVVKPADTDHLMVISATQPFRVY